jgi:hypothetical protein
MTASACFVSIRADISNISLRAPNSLIWACPARCAQTSAGGNRRTGCNGSPSTSGDTPGRPGCAVMAARRLMISLTAATGRTAARPRAMFTPRRKAFGIAPTYCHPWGKRGKAAADERQLIEFSDDSALSPKDWPHLFLDDLFGVGPQQPRRAIVFASVIGRQQQYDHHIASSISIHSQSDSHDESQDGLVRHVSRPARLDVSLTNLAFQSVDE